MGEGELVIGISHDGALPFVSNVRCGKEFQRARQKFPALVESIPGARKGPDGIYRTVVDKERSEMLPCVRYLQTTFEIVVWQGFQYIDCMPGCVLRFRQSSLGLVDPS